MGGGGIVKEERGGLGKGRVLTPRRRLGSGSEPPVGAGRGWGRGRGSRWAARAPGSCGGRGSVPGGGRRRGDGAGPRRAHPHARTRRARAHSRSGARPAESGAGAGRGRVGRGGRRRLAGGARGGIFRGGESGTEGRRGWGRPAPNALLPPLSVPAVREAHFPGCVSEQRPEGAEDRRLGAQGLWEGRGGLVPGPSSLPPPRAARGSRGLCAPRPGGAHLLPRSLGPAARAGLGEVSSAGPSGAARPSEFVCFSRPRSPSQFGSGDNSVTCSSGVLWCGE